MQDAEGAGSTARETRESTQTWKRRHVVLRNLDDGYYVIIIILRLTPTRSG